MSVNNIREYVKFSMFKAWKLREKFYCNYEIYKHGFSQHIGEISFNEKDKLLTKLKEEILAYLSFYTKIDLTAFFLYLRQYSEAGYGLNSGRDDVLLDYHQLANQMLEFLAEMENCDFTGASIGELREGGDDFLEALILVHFYIVLSSYMDLIFKENKEKVYTFVEFLEKTEAFSREPFFDRNLPSMEIVKFEEYEIVDERLSKKLDKQGKNSQHIENHISEILFDSIGVSSKEIRDVSIGFGIFYISNAGLIKQYEVKPYGVILIKREKFIDLCHKFTDVSETSITKVIDILSVQNESNLIDCRAIYIEDDILLFGLWDLMQAGHKFLNILKSGHFFNLLGVETDKGEKLRNLTADYFPACVYDVLLSNGYTMPLVNNTPIFNVKKINGLNLAEVGDIDVLAFDLTHKIIFNIETKVFKNAVNIGNLTTSDYNQIYRDSKDEKDTISKVLKREKFIYDNMSKVIEYFLPEIQADDFVVKSIIITNKSNFYFSKELENIRAYNFQEFVKIVEEKKLHT